MTTNSISSRQTLNQSHFDRLMMMPASSATEKTDVILRYPRSLSESLMFVAPYSVFRVELLKAYAQSRKHAIWSQSSYHGHTLNLLLPTTGFGGVLVASLEDGEIIPLSKIRDVLTPEKFEQFLFAAGLTEASLQTHKIVNRVDEWRSFVSGVLSASKRGEEYVPKTWPSFDGLPDGVSSVLDTVLSLDAMEQSNDEWVQASGMIKATGSDILCTRIQHIVGSGLSLDEQRVVLEREFSALERLSDEAYADFVSLVVEVSEDSLPMPTSAFPFLMKRIKEASSDAILTKKCLLSGASSTYFRILAIMKAAPLFFTSSRLEDVNSFLRHVDDYAREFHVRQRENGSEAAVVPSRELAGCFVESAGRVRKILQHVRAVDVHGVGRIFVEQMSEALKDPAVNGASSTVARVVVARLMVEEEFLTFLRGPMLQSGIEQPHGFYNECADLLSAFLRISGAAL